MSQHERRFHQRFRRRIVFELHHGSAVFTVASVNTSAGGAFISAPTALPLGRHRLLAYDKAGERRDLVIDFEAVHSVLPKGAAGHGIGGHWRSASSRQDETLVRQFLEGALGIMGARVRKTHDEGGPLFRFDFPEGRVAPGLSSGHSLADLLEPPRPGEPAVSLDTLPTPSSSGLRRRISGLFRNLLGKGGESQSNEAPASGWDAESNPRSSPHPAPSMPASAPQPPPHAREPGPGAQAPAGSASAAREHTGTTAALPNPEDQGSQPALAPVSSDDALRRRKAMRSLPEIHADVRSPEGRLAAVLSRVGSMSMDLACAAGTLPELYQRVVVTFPVTQAEKAVEVRVTGTVTRRKKDRRFTVRYVRVDEGTNRGAFERFVHEVSEGE